MKQFLEDAANQNHPLRILKEFLDKEKAFEQGHQYDMMRFVGYVLEIGYDEITIITSDPFKIAVGGIPRNSLLIMCPSSFESDSRAIPPHFTLLRVLDAAPTPLSTEVQQTYFELQKKSMPELDIFTQSELQWGALKTGVLGMFYPHPEKLDGVEFSGDLNNYVSAHKYMVYSPDEDLLDLVNNSMVPEENRFKIGKLRLTECRLPLPDKKQPDVDIYLSTNDFLGNRTAMFGKTRLGKSNVVKLIAQSLIETTKDTNNVGQLIFDINGEYANDNPQDDSKSIASVYRDRCTVYAITKKRGTDSKPLKLNFYENANQSKLVLASLLRDAGRTSGYIESFNSVELPDIEEVRKLPPGGDQVRAIRRLQIYWAILKKAGYSVDESKLRANAPTGRNASKFSPGFKQDLRSAAYTEANIPVPEQVGTLEQLSAELGIIARFRRSQSSHSALKTSTGNPVFEADDIALLDFLEPQPGRSGVTLVQPFRIYHDKNAGDFMKEILEDLEKGKTVILDLGNANEEVMQYFSRELSIAVFKHQTNKFTQNDLGNHYVQLYFEEAHNLFKNNDDSEETRIYRRFAKEGAKYHIGMVYSTQSPTTINSDLLAQTENFFVAYLASQDDVNRLAKVNVTYENMKEDILRAKTIGYIRMLTRSHRFVVSMQALRFTPPS